GLTTKSMTYRETDRPIGKPANRRLTNLHGTHYVGFVLERPAADGQFEAEDVPGTRTGRPGGGVLGESRLTRPTRAPARTRGSNEERSVQHPRRSRRWCGRWRRSETRSNNAPRTAISAASQAK